MVVNDRVPLNINQDKANRKTLNSKFIKIFHQNIRSIRNKTHELISHVYPDLPHVICLTEHHLNAREVGYVVIENYTIGAHYCRSNYQGGGAIIYVHNSLKFTNIDLSDYCNEKDIEICAIKISTNLQKICITAIYTAPSGNFTYFLRSLDNVLKNLVSSSTCLIICGDLNVNYLLEKEQKRLLLDN